MKPVVVNVEWTLNRNANKPLYQQIYEMIEERIAYGEFPPGSLLPSERKLALAVKC